MTNAAGATLAPRLQVCYRQYRAKAAGLDDVRSTYVLFYPISSGTVTIRSINLAR